MLKKAASFVLASKASST